MKIEHITVVKTSDIDFLTSNKIRVRASASALSCGALMMLRRAQRAQPPRCKTLISQLRPMGGAVLIDFQSERHRL